ncbi:unnamed protein product [Mucor hiemalis]
MKLSTALLASLACVTYFVSSSPIEDTDYQNGSAVEHTWSNGYEDWYCIKKNSHGGECVVTSMEHSPCQHGGKYLGCDDRRQHCWGCSVNNNKDWMWNQMEGWCHRQGGWLVKNKGNWHQC